jgi:hypothetical protein
MISRQTVVIQLTLVGVGSGPKSGVPSLTA